MSGPATGKLRTAFLLGLLPGVAGIALTLWAPTQFLERFGLDVLFQLRGPRKPPADVCVVALDDASYTELGLDRAEAWPRELHAELVRTLAREGARSVAFDVVFTDEGAPEPDLAFEAAMREAGNVVLGATVERVGDSKFIQAKSVDPFPPFAESAAAVAQVSLPLDRDGAVRRAWLVEEDRPTLSLAAYEVATKDRSRRDTASRFIDFYGPPNTIETKSYYQALDPAQYLPPGYFRGKIVFVGLSQVAARGHTDKDAFPTPFIAAGGETTFGVEIHATLAANLLEHREVRPLPAAAEFGLLLAFAFLSVLSFLHLRPLWGAFAFAAWIVVPWALGAVVFASGSVWLPVVIPSFAQIPIAYLASLTWYYLTTVRERERIRRAFSFYLSPAMIGRITADPGSLNLGGEEIFGTALMTDLQGFTTIAEALPPADTVAMLNAYFSDVTQHIFETNGTLIKFIGDAVFAIWGAPLAQPDHAARACAATLELMRGQARGGSDPRLVTRIGVHSGPMVVGNLGSSQRFDYTAIGDAVNLAARLEGLNKQIGTQAIVSDATLRAAGDGFVARPLGRVRVVGRAEPVTIHELVGDARGTAVPAAALREFAAALERFQGRRFEEAAAGFRAARELRGGQDGPSEFYLRRIDRFAAAPPPADWDGVVDFESK